jgi:hypothetical protein|tara:strand:- start:159 stop:395 length:237 start_codon:yes stop_codon:yes gene_type:complete
MEPESNVVSINGTDYIEDDLDEKQRYLINQIRDLQLKSNNLRFQLDQVVVAHERFTEDLIKALEENIKEEDTPQLKFN